MILSLVIFLVIIIAVVVLYFVFFRKKGGDKKEASGDKKESSGSKTDKTETPKTANYSDPPVEPVDTFKVAAEYLMRAKDQLKRDIDAVLGNDNNKKLMTKLSDACKNFLDNIPPFVPHSPKLPIDDQMSENQQFIKQVAEAAARKSSVDLRTLRLEKPKP